MLETLLQTQAPSLLPTSWLSRFVSCLTQPSLNAHYVHRVCVTGLALTLCQFPVSTAHADGLDLVDNQAGASVPRRATEWCLTQQTQVFRTLDGRNNVRDPTLQFGEPPITAQCHSGGAWRVGSP